VVGKVIERGRVGVGRRWSAYERAEGCAEGWDSDVRGGEEVGGGKGGYGGERPGNGDRGGGGGEGERRVRWKGEVIERE